MSAHTTEIVPQKTRNIPAIPLENKRNEIYDLGFRVITDDAEYIDIVTSPGKEAAKMAAKVGVTTAVIVFTTGKIVLVFIGRLSWELLKLIGHGFVFLADKTLSAPDPNWSDIKRQTKHKRTKIHVETNIHADKQSDISVTTNIHTH